MIYKEGSSIEIKGRFICVFKDYQNDVVKIENLERDFIFCTYPKSNKSIYSSLDFNILILF